MQPPYFIINYPNLIDFKFEFDIPISKFSLDLDENFFDTQSFDIFNVFTTLNFLHLEIFEMFCSLS